MKRIKEIITKHKGRTLLALFVVTSILYIAVGQPNPMNQPPNEVSPTPQSRVTEGTFTMTKTSLTNNVLTSVWSVEPITLYFDDVLDMTTFEYSIVPTIDTFISADIEDKNPTSVTIVPKAGWKNGASYTIRVKPTLYSLSNKVIDKEIVIRFRKEAPSERELGLPDHAF